MTRALLRANFHIEMNSLVEHMNKLMEKFSRTWKYTSSIKGNILLVIRVHVRYCACNGNIIHNINCGVGNFTIINDVCK